MNLRIALAALLWMTAAVTQAEMYVDRSIVIFEPGEQPREDVEVSNTGDDVMYVQVEVLKVETRERLTRNASRSTTRRI
ncbi:MAG: hypothetical protein U5O39_09580 [Gammaproteobacteria bacterium]|nr:hypothetical protein [Gammaproteobacteria bacterium]